MSLSAGTQLGPYEIVAFIGAGGMGEVFRATDTRLHRQVAIKISAQQFSERFEREARVIASLNHANICTLYDVGPNYLVMELVEGPTLAERIKEGPVPLEEALGIAKQIADALEAAHEKGVIHRDLKPANIKVTPDGTVKVLDFGLAKASEDLSDTSDPTNSPTLTISPTRAGMILGTAPYMAPEQARGKSVDKRADIWGFACVLYEMITGKQAFSGETTSDILASVLKEEPDWSRVPAKVRLLLWRCLVKDPKHRLRDIGDAMALLKDTPELVPAARPWPWIATAVLTIALGVTTLVLWRATRPVPPHSPVLLSAELSADTAIDTFRFGGGSELALSRDGTRIAVVERYAFGKYRLATRRLDQSEFAPLSGTEGANMPFFSPDGQWIGFFADGRLKKISVQGASPFTLCDAPSPVGASWGDDGDIVATLSIGGGLSRIPSGGGAPTAVTKLSQEKFERHVYPQVLPGSQVVLFTAWGAGNFSDSEIDIASLKTGQVKTVLQGGFFGRYLSTFNGAGHLLYIRQNTLFAAPFDLARLAVTGAAQPVLEDINYSRFFGAGNFDFAGVPSDSGTFVYVSSKGQLPATAIFWLDAGGKAEPLYPAPRFYLTPRFSPDGKRLAFGVRGQGQTDIWVQDLERDTGLRLTWLPGLNMWPAWTPDGKNLVFQASFAAAPGLYWTRADGAGEPHRLMEGQPSNPDISLDGKRVAYRQRGVHGDSEIWTAPLEGDRDHPRLGKAELFLRTPSNANEPKFSPDGRWLAYTSDETGISEVYVRPFPGAAGKRQISTDGGWWPIWSSNGHELFFLAPDRHIMVAGYTAKSDSFVLDKPRVWSERRVAEVVPPSSVDMAPDGKRFGAILFADGTSEPKPITNLRFVQNFFDELRQRVPANK